ncbi:BgTH12-04562 [Blumeria graminis f. sp. triticale]|uniref:Bgt-5483 n=2 Tax=Blumeria graminis TaxID=34373 RepID=A0A9X9L768_BLUGR|nr:BgTH12-04562 [Blumeria graminis f. sp. triticale]VCU39029.1 Bgt-5483 [Blumeria graminis f. sp. tritici]
MSSIENLRTFDPFAEADEDTGEIKQSQNYIHIRIQQRNGRKTLTTVQGLPKKFDQKKILKVIKKKFACNGTIVVDTEMGEVIQLQGDQRKDVQEFLTDKKEGLELDLKTIKVRLLSRNYKLITNASRFMGFNYHECTTKHHFGESR